MIEKFSGFLVGFLAAGLLLVIVWIVKRQKLSNKLDERQKLVQGSAAKHTLIIGAGLLLLNGAYTESTSVMWASLGTQTLILLALLSIYYISELVIRAAYFGPNFSKQRLRVFCFIAICYWVLLINKIIASQGNLLHSGKLTDNGWFALVFGWVAILYTIILIGWWRDHRRQSH